MEGSSSNMEERRSRNVLVQFSGDEARVMVLEDFYNFLERQPQLPRNGDGNIFFSCYLMRDNDSVRGQELEIPRDILRAMQAVTSREVGDPVDGVDEITMPNSSSGGICSVLSTLGETAIGGIKSVMKGASRVYKVAEILAGAFGPSSTRQKVERCLAEIGCLLIVLSLIFGLGVASSGKFKHKIAVSILYTLSLAFMPLYGMLMVALANKMATGDTYTDKFGRGVICGSIICIVFFIILVAFV